MTEDFLETMTNLMETFDRNELTNPNMVRELRRTSFRRIPKKWHEHFLKYLQEHDSFTIKELESFFGNKYEQIRLSDYYEAHLTTKTTSWSTIKEILYQYQRLGIISSGKSITSHKSLRFSRNCDEKYIFNMRENPMEILALYYKYEGGIRRAVCLILNGCTKITKNFLWKHAALTEHSSDYCIRYLTWAGMLKNERPQKRKIDYFVKNHIKSLKLYPELFIIWLWNAYEEVKKHERFQEGKKRPVGLIRDQLLEKYRIAPEIFNNYLFACSRIYPEMLSIYAVSSPNVIERYMPIVRDRNIAYAYVSMIQPFYITPPRMKGFERTPASLSPIFTLNALDEDGES